MKPTFYSEKGEEMIYTSYFAKLKSLPDNIIPISICAKAPNWYSGYEYKKIAPSYDILMNYKSTYNKEVYTERFNSDILGKLNQGQVVTDLYSLLKEPCYGKDLVLLCYEKSTDFCHRHLVAKWLNENGFRCKEWDG